MSTATAARFSTASSPTPRPTAERSPLSAPPPQCWRPARGRVGRVGVRAIAFPLPVHVGDVLGCYTDIVKVGTTSITVNIEAWALPRGQDQRIKVTEGEFVFVAIDGAGRKHPLPAE